MDNLEIISERFRNHIIDCANELARQNLKSEEEFKFSLITYSLIDAAVMYTVFMLEHAHGRTKLKNDKEDFIEQFQSYFANTLNDQINFKLSEPAASQITKSKSDVINLADYLLKR